MHTQFENSPSRKGKMKRTEEFHSSMSMPSSVMVKAKLEMTGPGDSEEREADEMADSIVSEGTIARSVGAGQSGGGVALPSRFGQQVASVQGQGSRITGGLKNRMESGFGRDFSDVRLHTDDAAAEMSASISAKAFTYGNDIFFNRGQFSPETEEGQHLIAHELTHVVQGGGRVAREPQEKQKDMFTTLMDHYPSHFYAEDGTPKTHKDMYSGLENAIVEIVIAHLDGEKLDPLIEEHIPEKHAEVKGKVKKFINSYKGQLSALYKENGRKDFYSAMGNIIRQVLLYDFSHFEKHRINLSQQVNGCGTRMTMAMANAGVKIEGVKGNYSAKGHRHYDIASEFPVVTGPKGFIKALKKQHGLQPLITVKLDYEDSKRIFGFACQVFDKKNPKRERDKKFLIEKTEWELERMLIRRLQKVKLRTPDGEGTPKAGLIIMETNLWTGDASGHVTLWDGEDAVDGLHVRFAEKKGKYQEFKLYDLNEINWTSF